MSHRYRSSCCCDSPDTLGTCFTGFGAVPKTGLNVDNCNSGHTEFNRFDNCVLVTSVVAQSVLQLV